MALFSEYAELDELGAGRFRQTIALKPIAYRLAGSLQRAVQTVVDSGDGTLPHMVTAAPLRLRMANDARRRFYPVPDDDSAYVEMGAPFIKIGGAWTQGS